MKSVFECDESLSTFSYRKFVNEKELTERETFGQETKLKHSYNFIDVY